MLDCLLFRQIKSELLLYLLMNIPMLDVRNIRVHHQGDQVQYQVRTFPEDAERCEAKVLEACIMRGLCTPHAINHLFTYFYRRWEGLGVAPKDIPEVNVEKMTVWRYQKIVQMPITDSKQLLTPDLKITNIPQLLTNVSMTPGSTPLVPTLPSSGLFTLI